MILQLGKRQNNEDNNLYFIDSSRFECETVVSYKDIGSSNNNFTVMKQFNTLIPIPLSALMEKVECCFKTFQNILYLLCH